MKKILFGVITIVYYLLLVYLFSGHQKYIFPLFLTTAFFFSMYLKSYKEVFLYFSPLFLIFCFQLLFLDIIYSIVIIYIIFTPTAFILGYKLKKTAWYYKTPYPILLVFISIYGFSNLFTFINNYHAKQTSKSPKIELLTGNDDSVRLDTIQNKIIVLDFWTTSCGGCFRKFPDYEKVYLNYENDNLVDLYTVNIPNRRDTIGKAKKMIEKYNYKFPTLYANSDTIPKSLGFNKYPHLIIIKNGQIRYNGLLVVDKGVYFNRLADEIELLLNE